MRARAGDWIVVEPNRLDQPKRHGLVVDARGPGGEPPFLVRWSDSEHECLVFPGPNAHVVPADVHAEQQS